MSKEHKLGIEEILDFMGYFNIVRPGMYDVSRELLEDTLRCFMSGNGIAPLTDYESAQNAFWEASKLYSDMNLLNADDMEVLSHQTIQDIKRYMASKHCLLELSDKEKALLFKYLDNPLHRGVDDNE